MKRVYFIRRADGQGPIKIGCSVCPEDRRRQLGSDLKAEMALLAHAPGGFRDEGRLHRQFADLRVKGEWFEPAPPLLAVVERTKRTGKLPPAPEEDREVMFARRYLAGETLEQIAAGSGITRERVRQILRKTGIPSLGHRKCHLRISTAEQQAETVVALAQQGKSAPDIARLIGDNAQNVRHCLKRRGLQPIKGKRGVSQRVMAQAAEVARLYLAGEKTADVARAVGVKQPHIFRLLRLQGVEPCRSRFTRLDAAAIIPAYRQGATMREIADRHGCSVHGVAQLLKRNGAAPSPDEAERRRIEAVRRANVRRAQERKIAA